MLSRSNLKTQNRRGAVLSPEVLNPEPYLWGRSVEREALCTLS